jgi:probable F420-dependent oxidoreductase
MVLTENWTITSPRDLRGLVRLAQVAEDEGIDTVMLSEHIVLGASAGADGRPYNPKDYAAPGNQDPATPWPDSIVLMSAIASATHRLRIAGAAIIAPLRHPLLLAHQLAALDLLSEGRLVVQPTVSWHEEEYDALGVPFHHRGALLDEHLAAWMAVWRQSPASFSGQYYEFGDVWLEPKPYRPEGPRLWFGGMRMSPPLLRRLVAHGHGFHPFGPASDEDFAAIREALTAAGRDISELEVIGGIRPRFTSADGPADIDEAAATIPEQLERGYTSICFNPSQYVKDVAEIPSVCRKLVGRLS